MAAPSSPGPYAYGCLFLQSNTLKFHISQTSGQSVNATLSQTNWRLNVWKNLHDNKDRGKIKVQKYQENAMKSKLGVRTNLSWPSLKKTFEKCKRTKNIN